MAIDVHGHVTSPALFERFPMPRSLADVEGMVARKAEAGISMTIVGSPVGAGTMVRVPGLDNYRQPLDQLAAFHDWTAEQVRAHPESLRAYAYTNPYGGDEMLESAARLLDQEEFVGLIVNSSVNGEFLDSPRAADFFAMAAEHDVPIMLHPPAEPAGSVKLRDPRLVEHVARAGDVATGVAAIVFAGWMEKHPGLRIIAPIAGGGLPMLVQKLEIAHRMPPKLGPGPAPKLTAEQPPGESLRRVYVDTATPSLAALGAAVRVLGSANVLFGTDTPPMSAPPEDALQVLGDLGLSDADRERILHGNAESLFGLSASAYGARGVKVPRPGGARAARTGAGS
jgi:predicted TIM-barrel fold metal-dependent hydrolase